MQRLSGPPKVDSPLRSFSDGLALTKKVYYLAFLPFLMDSFFLIGTYIGTTYYYSFRFGAKFSLPAYFPSLTNVYDFPSRTGLQTSLPLSPNWPTLILLSTLLYTVIVAYVAAGYLGKLNAARLGETLAFTSLANKYFARTFVYVLLWLVLASLLAVFALSSIPSAILYLLLLFAVDYLVFLTPFAVVVDNLAFTKALNRSIIISTSLASKTLGFVILYGFATLVISFLIYLILNLGILGFFIGVAMFAFIGTTLVASTLCFYVQATRPQSALGPTSMAGRSDNNTGSA